MKYLLVFLAFASIFGCSRDSADPVPATGPIVVAVLPDQSNDALLSRHAPLLDYFEDSTSLDIELLIPLDYADLLKQFDAGRIDVAWFGGLTFVQAAENYRAEPLAFRDIDLQFTSCYLVGASDTRTMIDEFQGANFSFGPSLSTSGHLMPRFYMTENSLDPEQFFTSIRHSAGHDQTTIWVRDGEVELGVANCIIVQSLFDNGVLSDKDVRVIETTPPYPDYVWAARATLDEGTKVALLDALLALDATVPEHRAILRSQGANAYLPAGMSDFEPVRTAALHAGISLTDGEK